MHVTQFQFLDLHGIRLLIQKFTPKQEIFHTDTFSMLCSAQARFHNSTIAKDGCLLHPAISDHQWTVFTGNLLSPEMEFGQR